MFNLHNKRAATRLAGWPLMLAILALSACAIRNGPSGNSTPSSDASVVYTTPDISSRDAQSAQPSRNSKGKLAPIPTRAINLNTACHFKDERGYNGNLTTDVKDAQVRQFQAEVNIPRRGTCNFDLSRFEQTQSLPIVKLKSRDNTCQVFMWSQNANITVAFNQCAAQCTGDAYDYLWPILVDASRGECS